MAELKKYLYNDLSFKAFTGVMPIMVNNTVVVSKQSIPKTTWTIDFGKVDVELKNAIEEIIFLAPNDTFIRSYVGPSFYIGKRTGTGGVEYYLTYLFEYKYYNTFVNKPLEYVIDGSDHLIEGYIRIPISQGSSDEPFKIIGVNELPRKLFYLETDLEINHLFNNTFSMKANFTELSSPLTYTNLFIAGVANANNLTYC